MKWYRLLLFMIIFVDCSGNFLVSCGLFFMKVVNLEIFIIIVIKVYYYFVVVIVVEVVGVRDI